jgi:hypothetical protein
MLPSYDRTLLVERIKMGYALDVMADGPDDTDTFALEQLQAQRAREEARHARQTDQPDEQRAHRRRADKAAYLRDKLAEADRAERAKKPGSR